VDISFTVCLFVILLQISLLMTKLAASNLHGSSSTSWAGNLPFWETLLPQKPKIGQIKA